MHEASGRRPRLPMGYGRGMHGGSGTAWADPIRTTIHRWRMKTNPYGAVFEGFRPWSGVVPAGLRAGFLGNVSVIDRLYPGKYIESLRE